MAAETSWHRYGTKLRHCHLMYTELTGKSTQLHDAVVGITRLYFVLYQPDFICPAALRLDEITCNVIQYKAT